MFLGAGPTEIVVILILAFVIFGPKRLPEVAKTVGKAMAEFKKISAGFQSAVQQDVISPLSDDIAKPATPKAPPTLVTPATTSLDLEDSAVKCETDSDAEAQTEPELELEPVSKGELR